MLYSIYFKENYFGFLQKANNKGNKRIKIIWGYAASYYACKEDHQRLYFSLWHMLWRRKRKKHS